MADNSILTPGCQKSDLETPDPVEDGVYLEVNNYFSEYDKESEKSIARQNLNVPSSDSVYTKAETDTNISKKIKEAIEGYLNQDDPHHIIPAVEEMIADMVKSDGSTPFKAAQQGVNPTKDSHLTTKKYVDNLVKQHQNASDPHQILPEVDNKLEKYVKTSEIYPKSQLYTQAEVNKKLDKYVKSDGTTPFDKAQVGVDPEIGCHLATKRYVDNTMQYHLEDIDPHHFICILNERLAEYAKKKNVFDKTNTYSRSQIDSIIHKIVNEAIDAAIADYVDTMNDKFEHLRLQKYVKQDGSIPFTNPQSGVDAVEDNELTTLRQTKGIIEEIRETLDKKIDEKECVWVTSGPVESTVGHVEDNTQMPPDMTLQEVCDAIFYGIGICLHVPDFVIVTDTCDVTMCVHGSTGMIEHAELWQGDELIGTYKGEDFVDGCLTVESKPLYEDTTFTFRVYYTSGAEHETSETVKCFMPIFVGLLPKWRFGNYLTMDELIQMAREDVEGTQNRFVNYADSTTKLDPTLKSFTFRYKFQDPDLRHPFIVLPKDYPNLESMVTKSQRFGVEAFNVINEIPLSVPKVDHSIIYKMYIYKQALSSLDQEVTFNFTTNEPVQ